MTIETITALLITLLLISGVFTLIAFVTTLTGGLFFSRTPDQFKRDLNDPRYDTEKRIGLRFSKFIFTYITPLFIAALILLIFFYFFM